MIGIEAGINLHQSRETFDQQPGSNQQNQRESDFGGHKRGTGSTTVGRYAALAFFQEFVRVGSRRLQSRHQPESNSANQRNHETESQNFPVDSNLLELADLRWTQSQ